MILRWAFKFRGALSDRRTWHLKGYVLKISMISANAGSMQSVIYLLFWQIVLEELRFS